MKNGVQLLLAELLVPIEGRQILRYEVAAIVFQILEVAGAKIIDHREPRIREFFLQRQREIGADEAGATSDNEIGRRVQFLKMKLARDR